MNIIKGMELPKSEKGFSTILVFFAFIVILALGFIGFKYFRNLPANIIPNVTSNQPSTQMGWVYKGVFPTSATNFTALKLPDNKFVAYYNSIKPGSSRAKPERAFSNDGTSWTPDPSWTCPDLCEVLDGQPSLPHKKFVKLKNGKYRAYIKSYSAQGVISFISSDGLNWTKEEGIRLKVDKSKEWEQGSSALGDFYPIYLSDGSIRAYYQGTKTPGPGENCGDCYLVLSAISKDDGLSFEREAGIRLDPRKVGQVYDYGGWGFADAKIIATKDGFESYVGNYAGPLTLLTSSDGLDFKMKGFAPLEGYNAEVIDLEDGRLVLIGGGTPGKGSPLCPNCPDNYSLIHILVWQNVPISLSIDKWDTPNSKTTVKVSGPSKKLVNLKVLEGWGMFCPWNEAKQMNDWNDGCKFYPELYKFTPVSGNTPLSSILTRSPSTSNPPSSEKSVMIGAEVNGMTVVETIRCVNSSLEFGGPSCK